MDLRRIMQLLNNLSEQQDLPDYYSDNVTSVPLSIRHVTS